MEKSKNIFIGILVCVIVILSCVITFILGAKYSNKEEENTEQTNTEIKTEQVIVSYIEEKESVPYITLSGLENVNSEIKNFYNSQYNSINYVYHVTNDILFINISKNELNGQEGRVYYLNYYIDLSNNKLLTIKDVLTKLNVNMQEFSTYCNGCAVNESLDNQIRLIPTDSFIYVDVIVMGHDFSSFFVRY